MLTNFVNLNCTGIVAEGGGQIIYHKMVHDAVVFPRFPSLTVALYGFSLRYYRIFYVSRFFFILLFLYFFFLFLGHKRTRRRCWAASCGFSQLREENAASFPCAFQFVYWFSLIAGRTSTTEREREGSAGSVIILLFSWVASRWWADDDSCG